MEVRRELLIVNQRGLHARASAKFVATIADMSDCKITVHKDGNSADGGSILGLMMLGAAKGDTVEILVSGPTAEARLAEISALIEDGFGEE